MAKREFSTKIGRTTELNAHIACSHFKTSFPDETFKKGDTVKS